MGFAILLNSLSHCGHWWTKRKGERSRTWLKDSNVGDEMLALHSLVSEALLRKKCYHLSSNVPGPHESVFRNERDCIRRRDRVLIRHKVLLFLTLGAKT